MNRAIKLILRTQIYILTYLYVRRCSEPCNEQHGYRGDHETWKMRKLQAELEQELASRTEDPQE